MREEVATERERQAAEAFERIRTGQHWRDWVFVAQGFEVGRSRAMREAGTNEPIGSAYNKAFGRWMDSRKWARAIDKATRNHLLWVADHLNEIEQWRETLPANQRDQWNHPSTVKRAYDRAHKIASAREAGETVASPVAQLKASLIESETERDNWKHRAEEGGSLFDLRRDTPEIIARIMVEQCASSRIERIVKALRLELKRQKEAHAA